MAFEGKERSLDPLLCMAVLLTVRQLGSQYVAMVPGKQCVCSISNHAG